MLSLSCLLLAASTVCADGTGYLTDYRHKDFGIGAELQYRPSTHNNQQTSSTFENKVYDRRHEKQYIPLQSSPSNDRSTSVTAPAKAGSAESTAQADHQRSDLIYDRRHHHQIIQKQAPRYIPLEHKNQPLTNPRYTENHQAFPKTPIPQYATTRSASINTQITRATQYVQPAYRTQQPLYFPARTRAVEHQPTAAPLYVSSPHQPVYVPRVHQPVYVPRDHQPVYVPRHHQPVYVPRDHQPVYVPRTHQPVYVPRDHQPVYTPRAQTPVHDQQTQSRVYVQQIQTTGQPKISTESTKSCGSSTLCFCCRWTTRHSFQRTQPCKQPNYGETKQVCVSIRNGVCIRFVISPRFGQESNSPASCISTRTERQCSSCCPSRYGSGMPRCTITATTKQELSSETSQTSYPRQTDTHRTIQPTSQQGQRSVSAAEYPTYFQVHQVQGHSALQSYYSSGVRAGSSRNQDFRPGFDRQRNSQGVSSSQTDDCCATTRQLECCASVYRYSHTRSPAVYKPPSRSYSLQSSHQSRSYNEPSYQRKNAIETAWRGQDQDCCATTRQVHCCSMLQPQTRMQPVPYNQIQTQAVAFSTASIQQDGCCSSSRRWECCAPSRASIGIPVSRAGTMCCGSSQPLVSCCASLRLADCCNSSRKGLCCSITDNAAKCCSRQSNWGK